MTLRFDHVVLRVDDLDLAADHFRSLGFTVVSGGEHSGVGSTNALVAFDDDSYLELIAFPKSQPRRRLSKHDRLAELGQTAKSSLAHHVLPWESAPEGFVDYALVPDDLDAVLARCATRGLTINGPVAGGRLRPDGQRVEWRLGIPQTFDLPFLCADVTPRSLRLPQGPARQHPNGARGIVGLSVVVRDFDASLARYRTLLDLDPIVAPDPEPHSATWHVGDARLTIVHSTNPDHGFARRLHEVGESPIVLWLRSSLPQSRQPIEPALAHGASIVLLSEHAVG
jgi:catechol 2,3-dioxygenase-like lactoylglutathione lyase family enzyme